MIIRVNFRSHVGHVLRKLEALTVGNLNNKNETDNDSDFHFKFFAFTFTLFDISAAQRRNQTIFTYCSANWMKLQAKWDFPSFYCIFCSLHDKIQLRKLIMAVNHLTGWKIINFNFHDECRTYPGNYLRTKWRLLMQHKMGPKMMKSSFIFIKLKKLFEASKSHLKLSDLLITSHKSRIHISKVERVLQAVLSKHE